MSIASYLKEKNFLFNKELNDWRNDYHSAHTSEHFLGRLSLFIDENSSKYQFIALNILFQELRNPLSFELQWNHTFVLLTCASICKLLLGLYDLCLCFKALLDMCCHFLMSDFFKSHKAFEFLIERGLQSIHRLVLGPIELCLALFVLALSIITRPLATLYYTGEYICHTEARHG